MTAVSVPFAILLLVFSVFSFVILQPGGVGEYVIEVALTFSDATFAEWCGRIFLSWLLGVIVWRTFVPMYEQVSNQPVRPVSLRRVV